jgi:hypothetical protein
MMMMMMVVVIVVMMTFFKYDKTDVNLLKLKLEMLLV